jgi:hypothetical protein
MATVRMEVLVADRKGQAALQGAVQAWIAGEADVDGFLILKPRDGGPAADAAKVVEARIDELVARADSLLQQQPPLPESIRAEVSRIHGAALSARSSMDVLNDEIKKLEGKVPAL